MYSSTYYEATSSSSLVLSLYQHHHPSITEKVLKQQETAKRQKHQDICETCRESLHPFIASADGMLAPEATKILQHLAHITANKTQKPNSAIVKHLRLRIAITLVKAAHHCLRAPRKKRHHAPSNNTPNQPSEPSPEYRMLNGQATPLATTLITNKSY
jgi:hypothetical protein